jgi:pyruvate kinase
VILQRQAQAAELLAEMTTLQEAVRCEGAQTFARWRPHIERRNFCASALNLAHYLALRRRDVRPLQGRLTPWGLSSLGRSEAHVLASLDAVSATLSLLAQSHSQPHPPMRRFLRGEEALQREMTQVFGAATHERRVRIMVTMPSEAAENARLVCDLVARGMDCARINCAHDTPEVWGRMIAHVRQAEVDTGFRCCIHMDLGGPKARTGALLLMPEKRRVFVGDAILLTRTIPQPHPDYPLQVQSQLPEALDQANIGDHVWIDDGKIGTQIEARLPEGLLLRVIHAEPDGGKLRSEKGLNFPDSDLMLNPLTPDDLEALDFIAQHADLIGYSFVQSGEDVALLQAELVRRAPERARQIAIIAKIETQRAIDHLPEIIVRAAGVQPFGVMIARGDLAVEIGFERLAEMQEQLLWICEAAHVPVIWATQVLETAVKKGRPARAEMTDAAMSARAECVMLNKGEFITDAVTLLDDVLRRMEGHQIKKRAQLRALRAWAEY